MPGLRYIHLLRAAARKEGVRIVAHHTARREQILEEELGCILIPTSRISGVLLEKLVLEGVVFSGTSTRPYHAYLGRHLLLLLGLLWYAIYGHGAVDLGLSIASKRDRGCLLGYAWTHTHALTLEELVGEGVVRLGHHFGVRRPRRRINESMHFVVIFCYKMLLLLLLRWLLLR